MSNQILYILIGLIFGIVIGWVVSGVVHRSRLAAHKRARYARKKTRQIKILNHFRIEVKNNTIRLKKELKRLGLSKQLMPIELHVKNYQKRLYRIEDKELLTVLQDFYKALFSLLTANETCIIFAEKNIQPNENLEGEVIAQFYNSMTTMIIQQVEKIIETGQIIVGIIEDKIE